MARTTQWGDYGPSRRPDAQVEDDKMLSEIAAVRHALARTMAQNFMGLPTLAATNGFKTSGHPHEELASVTDSDSDAYDSSCGKTVFVDSKKSTEYYINQLVAGRDISYRRSAEEFTALNALTEAQKQM